MIFDTLQHADLYRGLSEYLDIAFEYLANADFTGAEESTVEIDGTRVYAMIQPYRTASDEGREYEAHRRYIDLQYVHAGRETMICRNLEDLEVTVPYDREKDVCLYSLTKTASGKAQDLPYLGGTEVRMNAGDFVVLFPVDAHVPKIMTLAPSDVVKVVVKVLTDE